MPTVSPTHTSTVRLTLQPLSEGAYLARSPDVPGLNAQGRTLSEAVSIAKDLISDLVEFWKDEGIDLPPALRAVADGQTVELRIPVEVNDGR